MPQKIRVLIITLTYLSLFGLGLTDNLRGTLFPEILNAFSLSNSMGAYIFIVTSVFSILASLLSKQWLRRSDSITVWRGGILFMGLGATGFFLAPKFSLLLVSGAILGLGFGILAVTQNLLITTVATPSYKQKALSGLHSMYGFASFLSPLLVRELTPHHLSWKFLFLISGLLILLLYGGTFTIPKILHTPNAKALPPPLTPAYKSKTLILSMIISCYICVELLISTRMTSYLKFHYQWNLAQASLYLTYFFIGLLLGRVVFTFFHPPISTKKMLLISLLSSLMVISLGLSVDPLFLSLSGLFLAPFYPLSIALISELFPHHIPAVLSRTISFQSLFFISMNLSVGYWTDHFGIASAMNAAFIFGGLAWLLLMKL